MPCKICNAEIEHPAEGDVCETCKAKLQAAATDSGNLLSSFQSTPGPPEAQPGTELDSDSDSDGIEIWRYEGDAAGGLAWPVSIVRHPDGGFIVLDEPEDYRILTFDADGRFQSVFAEIPAGDEPGALEDPQGICVDAEKRVYVADSGNDCICIWNADGTFSHSLGQSGQEAGEFSRPVSVSIDPDGFIYVADSFNSRLQKFSADGLPCLSLSDLKEFGRFKEPVSVAVGPDRTVHVADVETDFLAILSGDGRPLRRWPEPGNDDALFDGPRHVRIDESRRVYVSDRHNGRIRRFETDGTPSGVIVLTRDDDNAIEPCGFDLLDGSVVVIDRVNNTLTCYEFRQPLADPAEGDDA